MIKKNVKKVYEKIKSNKILCLILVLSAILNIIGITWGLPGFWEIDSMTPRTLNMAKRMTPFLTEGRQYGHGVFYQYILAAPLFIYYLYLKATGANLDVDYINNYFPEFYNTVYILTRLVAVLFGLVAIYFTYKLGKELYDEKVGLLSAFFLSVSMGFINYAHFATVDMPSIAFALITLFFIVKYLKTGKKRYYFIAGIFVGVTISTKETTGLVLVYPMIISYFVDIKSIKNLIKKVLKWEWLLIFIFIILGYIITTPIILFQFRYIIEDFYQNIFLVLFNLSAANSSFNSLGLPIGAIRNVFNIYYSLGPLLFVGALLGFIYTCIKLLKKFNKLVFIVVFWIFIYYSHIALLNFAPLRIVLPIIPLFIIFTVKFFFDLVSFKKIFVAVVVLVSVFSVIYAIETDLMFLNDSRAQASKWIINNIPSNSTIDLLIDSVYYMPNIPAREKTNTRLDFVPYTGLIFVDKKPYYHINYFDSVENYSNLKKVGMPTEKEESLMKNYICNGSGDYLLITELHYGRYYNSPDFVEGVHSLRFYSLITEFYDSLLNEKYGWKIVGDFKEKTWFNPNPAFVNPRITILKKTRVGCN